MSRTAALCSHLHLARLAAGLAIGAICLAPAALSGKSPPTQSSATTAKSTQIYAVQCAGCHGPDAEGTDQGPALAGNDALRDRSVSSLRTLIRSGIPSSGMPAFDLPAGELDALATMVRSLNSPAAESTVPGDRQAGEEFFFGAGQCASCHMMDGRGKAVGPDLSSVGRELSVEEIRRALAQPSAHIPQGYEWVTVQLRDGRTVRGFARSRSNFETVLQDVDGQFHILPETRISSVRRDKQSIMPPLKASGSETQNLIAYLSSRSGVKPGATAANEGSESGAIPFSRILHPKPGDWLTYNGSLSGNRYSDLNQINTANVANLHLKWVFSAPLWKQFLPDTSYFEENMKYFGLEVTPLVADGIMYVTGPHRAFALDARTGLQIWEYSRPRPPGLVGDAALGTNRGAAILGEKIFMVTADAHLVALNRTTGQLVWEAVMPDEAMHYGSTVAPLVVKDAVIAGVSGGDWGIRGFVAAYEASTGKRLWRHWTIPASGEPGAETWGPNPRPDGGGATWLTGSYDPETDTLYWPTGNPYPDSDDRTRPGDNLYTNSILALNSDTGALKWFYQVTPHDIHDWDANAPLVLVDTKYQGQNRKLLLHANKNGFFYVLDRTNGRVLRASKFVRATWASGIGPDGRPQLVQENGMVCPDTGTNWNATAFSPLTHFYYLMAFEKCDVKLSSGDWRGRPQEEPGKKFLRALDIDTGKVAWEVPQIGPPDGKREAGVLATAGGILIYGDPSGDVVAVDQRSGQRLWHFPTNGENKTSPMTYKVGDEQFIALAVGPNVLCFGLP